MLRSLALGLNLWTDLNGFFYFCIAGFQIKIIINLKRKSNNHHCVYESLNVLFY